MTIKWKTPAGRLRTLIERVIISQDNSNEIILEAESTDNRRITYSLISGQLPRGLRLSDETIKQGTITKGYVLGSAVEVRKFTENRFVIRADDGVDIEDRTFSIAVDGSDEPEWITKQGFLNVGKGKAYYVLDNSQINFQLEADDQDINAGETLTFNLRSGELPPGIALSSEGIISGYTDPIFALEYQFQNTGAFDIGSYDIEPLDYGRNNSVGFDNYFYDTQTYDYSETPILPRRLSRIYTFGVEVTDGIYSILRIFKIYVVTEDFLKADNTLVQVDTNVFTADSNQHRIPIWITDSNLGRIRANNYVTVYLDVYDPPTLEGTMTYFLLEAKDNWISNKDYVIGDLVKFPPNSNLKKWYRCLVPHKSIDFNVDKLTKWEEQEIPPGLELDSITGELAGKVPYQDRVTKQFRFTVLAVNFPLTLANLNYTLVGDWNRLIFYEINQAVRFDDLIYICIKPNEGILPTNDEFWRLGVSTAEKTFTLEVIGEIESGIRWITGENLGTIVPNIPSIISIDSENQLKSSRTVYELIGGSLPPGLELTSQGYLIGKVKQFGNKVTHCGFWNSERKYIVNDVIIYNGSFYICRQTHVSGELFNLRWWSNYNTETETKGITTFSDLINDERSYSIFDSGETTFDQVYHFKIKARDTARASENIKDFFLEVRAQNFKVFANVFVKALTTSEERLFWYNFISDSTIFDPDTIYRYGDPNFGIQSEIKMLVFGGIESTQAVKYVQSASKNHYRKRLLFGDVKTAKAKDPVTQETLYEVIYTEIIDELEKNGKSISKEINLSNSINSPVIISYDNIRIDSDALFVSDRDHQTVFPNSIKNMRSRLREVGERNREFLPLWMRSIQDTSQYELGYTKALVLCYVKPGQSAKIVSRIRASGFDFKLINFYSDRYIIDAINGEIEDRYIAFPQRDNLNKLSNPKIVQIDAIPQASFDNDTVSFDSNLLTFDQG